LSFHPVKHITTAEGGAVLTNDAQLAARARELRTHGIHRVAARLERTGEGPWYYEQAALGFNYRLSDLQCALGISQLAKLERFLARRREIAAAYDAALSAPPLNERLAALERVPGRQHAYHLYVVRVKGGPKEGLSEIAGRRFELYRFLRDKGILTQVHYVPVNWHPYYRHNQSTGFEDCPGANAYYAGCLSLPMYPLMSEDDVGRVVQAITEWARR
jgi:dTDP-4-amino-4,6-dideoxygalactose transaminase